LIAVLPPRGLRLASPLLSMTAHSSLSGITCRSAQLTPLMVSLAQFNRDSSSIVFLYHIGGCKVAGQQVDAAGAAAGSRQTWTYLFTVAADGSNLWRVPVCPCRCLTAARSTSARYWCTYCICSCQACLNNAAARALLPEQRACQLASYSGLNAGNHSSVLRQQSPRHHTLSHRWWRGHATITGAVIGCWCATAPASTRCSTVGRCIAWSSQSQVWRALRNE
jgi:hypothetical protein